MGKARRSGLAHTATLVATHCSHPREGESSI